MTPVDFQRVLAFIIRFDFKFNHKRDIKEQCNNILKIFNNNSTIADRVDQTLGAIQPEEVAELLDRLEAAQMSLRDYFAAKAMQGLLAAQIYGFNDRPAKGPFASMAYEMADAMLKAREEEE